MFKDVLMRQRDENEAFLLSGETTVAVGQLRQVDFQSEMQLLYCEGHPSPSPLSLRRRGHKNTSV